VASVYHFHDIAKCRVCDAFSVLVFLNNIMGLVWDDWGGVCVLSWDDKRCLDNVFASLRTSFW
jgi:hypothetical protein